MGGEGGPPIAQHRVVWCPWEQRVSQAVTWRSRDAAAVVSWCAVATAARMVRRLQPAGARWVPEEERREVRDAEAHAVLWMDF